MSLQFGEFTFDRATRLLRRDGADVPLTPKVFELLDLLLRERPRVVTKEQIHARLWPKTFVSESTLATVVTDLRIALADDAKKPRFVRTVHRVGYAFCGDARESGSRPNQGGGRVAFRLILEDREVALRPGENLLGRVEDGVAWIDAATVSRRHARILVEGDQAILEDLGSKNGTFVRGERVLGPTPLVHGDVIRLGRVTIKVQALRADISTRSEAD